MINFVKILVKKISIEKYTAWKKKQLYFKNDRFEDIIKKLERHFDISIELKANQLKDTRFTGTFSREKITEVLNTFKVLSDFSFAISNNKVIINN